MSGTNLATRRAIDDTGEKIGGARKDWKSRAMTVGDLGAMTPAERAATVRKDNAWPVPDYGAMVASGMEPEAAALVKVVRDRLAAKPVQLRNGTPEAAATGYVTMLGLMRDTYAACVSAGDVRAAERKILEGIGWTGRSRDPALGQLLYSVFKGNAVPFRVGFGDVRKASAMVAEGFPGAVPAWRKGVTVMGFGGALALVRDRAVLADGFADEAAAWEWLRAKAEERKAADPRVAAVRAPDRPHLDSIGRTGPDRRAGRAVSPEDFLSVFGFRGVEFGNWLPDDERQRVLDMGFDALHDLADVLGIEPRGVSLGGTLAVAFGARGQGGAAAHYEPGRRVLNLTRLNGAGSLAHEWAHGLDHWLGTVGGNDEIERGEPRFASGYHAHTRSRAAELPRLDEGAGEAVDRMMEAFRRSPRTRERAVADASAVLEDFRGKLARNLAMRERHVTSVPGEKQDRKWLAENAQFRERWTRGVEMAAAALEATAAKPGGADFGLAESSFHANAQALCGKGGDYWKRPTEMVARALECHVFDALAASGRKSEYLVHGVEDGRFASPSYKGDPYPSGAERAGISAAVADLVSRVAPLLDAVTAAVPTP